MSNKNNKQAYRENDRHAWPAWVWLGLGVLLGLALSALVLIKDWAPMLRRQNLPQPNAAATAPKDGDQALADANTPPPAPKKTYDFYSVLPEMEVVIPDAELTAKAKAEQQRQQATATTTGPSAPSAPPAQQASGHYVLLAGSYTDPRAADEAKAKLAMLGVIAQVQSISINGKTWNRVMVGPYANASDTEATKKILADNGIKAIPMKQASNP
ncbi:MAG: SPOR domain-containing protein [Rudaea sp.]